MFGLGFVLGFGYWTTNFAEIQRALSASNVSAARRTPLIGAFAKIFLPAIIILPGLIAVLTVKGLGGASVSMLYNTAIPHLIGNYLPEGMLGIAVTELVAAFMAGVAANVTATNTVVTYDLIQAYVIKDRDSAFYLRAGRWSRWIATVGAKPRRRRGERPMVAARLRRPRHGARASWARGSCLMPISGCGWLVR